MSFKFLTALTITLATAALSTPSSAAEISPAAFGALPNDELDDTAGIQAALDALESGDVLAFQGGEYLHSGQLFLRDANDVRLEGRGSVLRATDPTRSALTIQDSLGVQVIALDLVATATERLTADRTCGLLVYRSDTVILQGNRITGFAGCGVMVQSSERFIVVANLVRNTFADGIHVTNGATGGLVLYNMTFDTGDDGIAVVSYRRQAEPVRGVVISGNAVQSTPRTTAPGTPAYHGRGIAVDGGESVTIENNTITGTSSACVLVASSSAYDAWPVSGVVVHFNTLTGCNAGDTTHGAVLVSARAEGPIDSVSIWDNSIHDTVGANAHIRVSPFTTGVTLERNHIFDVDSSHVPWTFYSGAGATATDNTYNGAPTP